MRFFSIVVACFLLPVALGCGSQASVSGKVTFEDGTPLTTGEVRFEAEGFMASGRIQPDGTYRIGTVSDTDGVPKGTYGVTVQALDNSGGTSGAPSMAVAPGDAPAGPPPKSLIDTAFGSVHTSGLTCEVQKSRTFDITVRRPN